MFVADLCHIFIYIIKWFLKSPALFLKPYENTKTIVIEVCILLNKYNEKKYFGIFLKETSKSNTIVSNNSQCRALHLSMQLPVICSAFWT